MDESQKHCAEQKMPHTCPKVKTLLFHSYEILKKENIYGDRSQKVVSRGGGRRKSNWEGAQGMTFWSDGNVLYPVLHGGCSSYVFAETHQIEYLTCTSFQCKIYLRLK